MTLFDYPRAYRESLGVFEALRRLGFSSDDIYFMVCGAEEPGPTRQITMVLRAQDKEFVVITGYVDGTVEEIQATWKEIATALSNHEILQKDLDKSWQESSLYHTATAFVYALLKKGFVIPRSLQRLN